jgi:outer membrane protein assembly factor BamB
VKLSAVMEVSLSRPHAGGGGCVSEPLARPTASQALVSGDEEQELVLRRAILNDCLKFKEGYDSAGDVFDCFVDLRKILHRMPFLQIAARLLWSRIRKYQPALVGGMSTAADPLVFALLYEAYAEGCDVAGFTVRSEAKTTGLRNIVEGTTVTEGDRVVIVDDLLNSGSTIVKCATHVRERGANLVAVGVVFDYESAGRERVSELGVPLECLTTSSEIGITAVSSNKVPALNWTFVPLNDAADQGQHASPVVCDDTIYVGSNLGAFLAMSQNGIKRWRLPLNRPGQAVRARALIKNQFLYFGASDGDLYCADRRNGELIWEQNIGDWIATEAAYSEADNLLFTMANHRNQTSACVAMNPSSGGKIWETSLPQPCHLSGLAVSGDRVIVGSDSACLLALECATGKILWSFTADGPIRGHLASNGNLCFFGALDGWCYAVDLHSGRLRWKRHLADQLCVCPAIHGESVFVPGATHLVAMHADTGTIAWIAPTPARMMGPVVHEASHTCIGGSEAGYVCAYDLAEGKQQWRIRLGKPVRSLPAISDSICVVVGGETLFGIDLTSPEESEREFGIPGLSTVTILSP